MTWQSRELLILEKLSHLKATNADLLAALEAMLSHYRHHAHDDDDFITTDQARAAIAKARGNTLSP